MPGTATEAEEAYKQETAAYVAAARAAHGWSIAELAKQAKLDRSTVSRAAGGKKKTDFHRLLKIEKASGVAIPQSLHDAYEGLSDRPSDETDRIYSDALDVMRRMKRTDPDAFERAVKQARGEPVE